MCYIDKLDFFLACLCTLQDDKRTCFEFVIINDVSISRYRENVHKELILKSMTY